MATPPTKQQIIAHARTLAPKFAGRAAAAEEARRISAQSAREMLDAGIARILMPQRFGGYELDFDTWLDVALEISKADASHGWCASLIAHHAQMITQFPEACQRDIWADGPDVAIAASIAPRAQVTRVDGGYRVSGQSSVFASGIDHSTWVMVGGMAKSESGPQWLLFMIPPGEYQVRDVWFTAGMRGTGSNTIVTDNAFVPDSRVTGIAEVRAANGPGRALHDGLIYRTPFYFYAPLTFAAPMLGAALGAYEHFREWVKTRTAVDGSLVAEKVSTQVNMARAAATLDAAELLLRRTATAHHAPESEWPRLVARSVRDFTRVSELTMEAIDTLAALSGSAGFASSHPVQRAWRDIHFASTHIALNPEANYGHFGRMELGLPRDPGPPF